MNIGSIMNGCCRKVLCTCIYLLSVFLSHSQTRPSSHIVNPHPFEYHINNEKACLDHKADVLIWIHTAPDHFRHRTLIRHTWANPSNFHMHNITLVFFLGMSRNETTQKLIEYESETYKDIVQETFIDSYRNLTYKAIAGCKWTSRYCKSAGLVLKADDDMVVDIYLLFRHIKKLRAANRVISNTLLCDVWYGKAPQRTSGKWKITEAEYNETKYPPYCPGLGLVMTADIIPKLYNQSFYEPYFWVDDVYFTGLLARTIKANFEQLASTVHFGPSRLIKDDSTFKNPYQWIFYHVHEKREFRILWDTIAERESKRIHLGEEPAA